MSSSTRSDLFARRWRFVVCLCSFYVNAIVWGFLSSTGLFEDALRTSFDLVSFQSILPGSIQIGTMSISSIFASILTIRVGVRWTTIAGSFIATLAFILSALIGDYWAFCLFYGVFLGIGKALMLVSVR
jgi:fucose permease